MFSARNLKQFDENAGTIHLKNLYSKKSEFDLNTWEHNEIINNPVIPTDDFSIVDLQFRKV
jgi:hypothetical protein